MQTTYFFLQKCCKFFSQLEQDEEEMKLRYLPFCHYIVQDEFLKETKDENCCILIGCVLADIFRLHAPENPFRSAEKIKVWHTLTLYINV